MLSKTITEYTFSEVCVNTIAGSFSCYDVILKVFKDEMVASGLQEAILSFDRGSADCREYRSEIAEALADLDEDDLCELTEIEVEIEI
jgi:hypothetical protein